VDLTADALKAKNIAVDMDGFNTAMEQAKAVARASWAGAGGEADDKIWFKVEEKCGATEFLGYDTDQAEAQILAIVKDGQCVQHLDEGDTGYIVVNQTPFYAESGGQVGDTGTMTTDADQADVTNTLKKLGKVWAHQVTVTKGSFALDDAAVMVIDTDRRNMIRGNHSATHLLHEALRQRLGDHVAQKGSLQDENRTRFDISHPKGITAEELAQVEADVMAEIAANTPVVTRVMPLEEAKDSGARALFGEKYDDEVRVVSMGRTRVSSPRHEQSQNANLHGGDPETSPPHKGGGDVFPYSVELCGGTHVKQTGDIGKFKIISESAVSAGVRRVEAITGARVDAYISNQKQKYQETIDRLRKEIYGLEREYEELSGSQYTIDSTCDDEDMLVAHVRALKKSVDDMRRAQGASQSADDIKEIGTIKYVAKVLDGFAPKDLKPMADMLTTEIGSGVVTLVSVNEGKASIVVAVTQDLTDRYNAVDLVKIGSMALGGQGGGGRPDMAQAGGPNGDAANDALTQIEGQLAG
jgi:alanyl-tRNA synthetase